VPCCYIPCTVSNQRSVVCSSPSACRSHRPDSSHRQPCASITIIITSPSLFYRCLPLYVLRV
jgi:hypothetical protein